MDQIRINKRNIISVSIVSILLFSVIIWYSFLGIDPFKQAQKAAIESFENDMNEADINPDLFVGPTLMKSNDNEYVFQWATVVPESGATIIEISVSKRLPSHSGSFLKGKRAEPMYLAGTSRMPIDKAMLTTLFNLPSDTSNHSIFVEPLREARLRRHQLSDVASFIHIKRDLMEYIACHKVGYPDSLEEFNHILNPEFCAMFSLDSLYLYDHWGNKYYYKNLGQKVILGTPGKNGKWDFSDAVMDSLFNLQLDQIYTTDDDIIVKFSPAI